MADAYQQIFTQFPHAIFIENSEGRILDANAAAAEALNVPLSDLLDHNSSEFLSPASLERLSPQLKALDSGNLHVEVQFVPAGDKEPVEMLLDISPLQWPAGKGADKAFLMIAREIDAREDLQRELLVHRNHAAKDAGGCSQAAFFISASDTAIRYPAATKGEKGAKGEKARPLDWAGGMIVGPVLRMALDQAWSGKEVFLKPAWYSSHATGVASSTSEALAAVAEQARKSGDNTDKQYWLEIGLLPLRGKSTEVSGICALVRDRTAERIAAEQQRFAEDQATLALLASSLRHELNNYLSVIIAQASALRMSLAPGQLPPPNVGAILDAGQEAVALLRRSSEVAGRGDGAFSDVRLNDVVTDAVHLLRHVLPEGVRVSVDLGPDVPLIRGEPRLLRAAVLALAKQVQTRAVGGGGTLAIKTHCPPPIHASVPPAAALTIQISGGASRNSLLTGPGESPNVAVARAIARYHKGQLEAVSRTGGTIFEINLPGLEPIVADRNAARSHAPLDADKLLKNLTRTAVEGPRPQADDEAPRRSTSAQAAAGVKRVLVADDEENFRAFIGFALRQHGYDVVLTSNGQEAFERFQQAPASFHLAILDAYMPLMGGLESYLRMHVLRPDLPVLFASGFFRTPSIEALVDGCPGPAAVLMKPFGADDLLKAVETALSPAAASGEFEPADSNSEE